MTASEVTNILDPAIRAVYGLERSTISFAHKLEGLLGTNEYSQYYNGNNDDAPMSDELRHQLLTLAAAGLHAMTIVKIIRIRKGLEP